MDSSLKKQVESWFEKVKLQTEDRLQYIQYQKLDDSFGWGEMLRRYLDCDSERIKCKRGLLFSGPYGSGKHQAAYHVIQYLTTIDEWVKKHGENEEDVYKSLILSGEDFLYLNDNDDRSFISELLDIVFEEYDEKKLCLVLENPEYYSNCQELLRHIGRINCIFRSNPVENPHLMIIVITNAENEEVIPPILREHLMLCRMSLPNREKRQKFLETNAGLLNFMLSKKQSSLSVDELLDITEGMSYAQLRDLSESALLYLGNYDETLVLKGISAMVEEQLPDYEQEDIRTRLYLKLEDFIDALPELLEKFPLNTGVQYVKEDIVKKQETADKKESLFDENGQIDQKKVEASVNKMTGRQLGNDLFGAEKTEEMIRRGINLKNSNQ